MSAAHRNALALIGTGIVVAAGVDAAMVVLEQRELEDVATEAAGVAQDRYFATGDAAVASGAAQDVVRSAGVGFVGFSLGNGGSTTVEVSGTARSFVGRPLGLGRLFAVERGATAPARVGAPVPTTTPAGSATTSTLRG